MAEIKLDADVIIIGGGPAGISAAVWCSDLGLSSILFDNGKKPGGQLFSIYNRVENYPGLMAENGTQIAEVFHSNLKGRHSVILKSNEAVDLIDINEFSVKSGKRKYVSKAIIFASGVRRKRLGIPAEEKFADKGILRSGALEYSKTSSKNAMVIGGGDAAFENALLLSKAAKKVYLVHRRKQFSARSEFVEKAKETANIEIITDCVLADLEGADKLEKAQLKNVENASIRTLGIDHIIFRLGVVPNSELLAGKVLLDEKGYVITDRFCQTALVGIYAAGDVVNHVSPTIVTAAGMGAAAAKSAYKFIERMRCEQ